MKTVHFLLLSFLLSACSPERIQIGQPFDVLQFEEPGNTSSFESTDDFDDLFYHLDSVFSSHSHLWSTQADTASNRLLSKLENTFLQLLSNDLKGIAQSAMIPVTLPDVAPLLVKVNLGTVFYRKTKKQKQSDSIDSKNSLTKTKKVEMVIDIEVLQKVDSTSKELSAKSLKKSGLLVSENPLRQFGQLVPSPYAYPVYNVDSIYNELVKEASKSNLRPNTAHWFRNYADSIKLHGNNRESFFPHCDFDEVNILRVNEGYFRGIDNDLTSNRLSKDTFQLSSEQITGLLRFMNNPLNFWWAECGTAIPQYEIQFLLEGKVVNGSRLACEYGQFSLSHSPGDINYRRTKYGAVNSEKRQPLLDILKESGAYFHTEF